MITLTLQTLSANKVALDSQEKASKNVNSLFPSITVLEEGTCIQIH